MEYKTITLYGFEGLYRIYKDGRIFSMRKNRFMRQSINNYGYKMVMLTGYRSIHTGWFMVHRLVASHYCNIIDNECFDINHKDMNKGNNNANNLEYTTHHKNIIEARKLKQWNTGKKKGFKLSDKTKAKMSVKKYKRVKAVKGSETLEFESIQELIDHFGIYRKKFNRLVNSYKVLNGYILRYCK